MRKKAVKIIAVVLAALAGIAALLILSGALVRPTASSLEKMTEVPRYDVLEWQYDRETEILADYAQGGHTFENPYVITDPYDMNPCSALMIYETASPGSVRVTVQGDDAYSTYSYTVDISGTHCEIPVIGLYAGRENTVLLESGEGTTALAIQTEPLPADFQTIVLEKSVPEKMEPGITLTIACFNDSYTALLDSRGEVRGFLSNRNMAHGTSIILLKNGNMMATGDEFKQIPYNMASLWEFNWLGKVLREYEIPNAVHHGISELPNGDILAVSNGVDIFAKKSREDAVIIIDRATGAVKKEYDFCKILDDTRAPYSHFELDIKNQPAVDWMHANAAIYDQATNSIIVSSPIQSQVVSIDADTSSINWILGPPEGYEGNSARLQQYLLTPEGSGFEWQWGQHDPEILPDFDNDPNTMDILLFDNGQNRSFYKETALLPEDNYSRAVQYRIHLNEKTVEQIWEYGKERGVECYASYLGDADYLDATGNRLIAFGGQLRENGEPTDNIIGGVFGKVVTNSRVCEVTGSGEDVFEISICDNAYTSSAETYQAERIPLFSAASFKCKLGEEKGERLGESYKCAQSDMDAPKLFIGKLGVDFDDLHVEGGRLVATGAFQYDGQTYLLGKVVMTFTSPANTYVYETVNSLNGIFFFSLDLSELESGTYQISVAGGVREGNDTQNGKMMQGNVKTGYKVTVG